MSGATLTIADQPASQPGMPVGDWLARIRPAVFLFAVGRDELARPLWDHRPLVNAELERLVPMLRGAALTVRADRDASCEAATRQLGQRGTRGNPRELWAHVADATWTEAAIAARHRLADAAQPLRDHLGAEPIRLLMRTFGHHSEPKQLWQLVADVPANAAGVIAWDSIGRAAQAGAFDPLGPAKAWQQAAAVARAALAPVLADLDQRALASGITWSTP